MVSSLLPHVDILFLSRFNTVCGISTYTEQLADAISALEPEKFSVGALASDHCLDDSRIPKRLTRALVPATISWSETKPLKHLVVEIGRIAPKVVHIQHDFGIFKTTQDVIDLCRAVKDRWPRIKFILTLHSVPVSASLLPNLFSQMIAAVDAVIVHSEKANKAIQGVCKKAETKIFVIRHGLLPLQERADHFEAEEALGISHKANRFTILMIGFIFPSKNHLMALCYLEEVVKKRAFCNRDVFIIIAGLPVPPGTGEGYANKISYVLETKFPPGSYLYDRKFISFEDLPMYYGASDITLHTGGCSHLAASGSIRMDLSFGMTSIVQKSNMTEDLPWGVVKFFEKDKDIMKTVSIVARNPKLLQETRSNVEKFVSDFSWEKIARQHVMVYQHTFGSFFGDTRQHVRETILRASKFFMGVCP